MDTAKNFLTSKTIWGLIIAVAGMTGIGEYIPADFTDTIVNFVNAGFEAVGVIIAAYGRYKAKDTLTILPKKA